MSQRAAFGVLAFLSLLASAAGAQQDPGGPAAAAATALHARLAKAAARKTPRPELVTSCTNAIACGETVQAGLVAACQYQDGAAIDLFSFNGTNGQQVTITAASNSFPMFLDLEEPSDFTSLATGNGSPAVINTVLDNTGTWTIGVSNFSSNFQAGDYSLTLTCPGIGGGGGCSPNGTTLCLEGGRFSVTATFDAGASGSGQAQAVSLTDDTGYLWFFDATNVEAVVKVLNGCGLGGHYWVFAGGLTNVNVVMTVTDTSTGATQTYTNPADSIFRPIQDTAAFSTCP